jgi:hypothetical protein
MVNFRYNPLHGAPFGGSQVRLEEVFKTVSLRLFKPAGLKDDLRPCVVNDVASELLAFYDQACIGEAARDVLRRSERDSFHTWRSHLQAVVFFLAVARCFPSSMARDSHPTASRRN